MKTRLTMELLQTDVENNAIDTVLVCFPDMQGRLMGKRFHAEAFLEMAHDETHCCNYLLATDLEMATPDGYAATSWSAGYGDYVMKPDLSTLAIVPWLQGTAMVLCDILDHHSHEPISHSPRQVLKRQIKRCEQLGFTPIMATELEFFLFSGTADAITRNGFRDLQPIGNYNEDYHIFQTTKEEHIMRPIRNYLRDMGIPVEGSKGEAEAGQEELNIKYSDALHCADNHTIAKHAIKEIAYQHDAAATFLAKWHHDRVGSSAHIHQSLWENDSNAFYDAKRDLGKSELMDHYLAGLITYAADYTYFTAPYINSYKRFAKGTFAPTRLVWSIDNRTAAFRLCADGTQSIRIECRIPGSDMNPYLAQAAMLAAGLAGIEEQLTLADAFKGDAYNINDSQHIPKTLRHARDTLNQSAMLRSAMGDEVVDHYCHTAQLEIEDFERVVTDYEVARGFERS